MINIRSWPPASLYTTPWLGTAQWPGLSAYDAERERTRAAVSPPRFIPTKPPLPGARGGLRARGVLALRRSEARPTTRPSPAPVSAPAALMLTPLAPHALSPAPQPPLLSKQTISATMLLARLKRRTV